MRMVQHSRVALAGAALVLVIGINACTTDHGTAPATPIVSQAQADSLAKTVVSDVVSEMGTATMDGAAAAPAAAAPVFATAPMGTSTASQCIPAKSPASPLDSDHDGVPDSVRFDYAGCVISYPLAIDSLSGTIDLIDPTVLTADHAVERVFTNFRRATVNLVSNTTRAVTDNGVRTASHDMTTLRTSETNFRTDYVYGNGATAEHVRTWTVLFTADVAGAIQPNALLPSGTWTVTGTSSWTRGHSSYSLTVTTNPPLHYNASCTTAPRFDAGTITAVVTQGTHTMTLSIQFTACGKYMVTRS
jgi:hypothetical protein